MPFPAYRALCARWASIWSVPALILEVVGTLESGRNPTDANLTDPRAIARGGAWGLFGLTLETARTLLAKPTRLPHPAFALYHNWDRTGPGLLNLELNAALAGQYLGQLWREFGNFVDVLAAYHQGPATVRAIRARGGDVATEIGPKGREYVAKGLAVRAELEGKATA